MKIVSNEYTIKKTKNGIFLINNKNNMPYALNTLAANLAMSVRLIENFQSLSNDEVSQNVQEIINHVFSTKSTFFLDCISGTYWKVTK